jgi:preprotein translocase subunit SecB
MSDAQPQPQPSFQIEKVYVKDLSLEIPGAPRVFMEQVQPELEVQIGTEVNRLDEKFTEVTVSATVTARAGERTVFLAEAVQAGIFSLSNVPQRELEPLLHIGCPTILFPYLREAISDLIVRGGFPPVLLAPVSFEALFMQRAGQPDGPAQGEGPRIQLPQ